MQESWTKDRIPRYITAELDKSGNLTLNPQVAYEEHVAVNRESTIAKKPFLSRVWGWFIGLGVLGGILAFFFPTAFFAIIIYLVKKWNTLNADYAKYKLALEETVAGIKAANIVVSGNPVAKALNDATSKDTQVLVSQIKATL
jgi:hypothetical protein